MNRPILPPSPLSISRMASKPTRLHRPLVNDLGVYCLQSGPDGKTVVRFYPKTTAARTLPTTSADGVEINVGTRVHEYSDDSYALIGHDVLISNQPDGRLYRYCYQRQQASYAPPIPASFAEGANVWRYTNFAHGGNRIYAVVEIHDQQPYPRHAIADITDPEVEPQILYQGPDFIAGLQLSPSGETLAWYEWDFGNMPWDATRMMCAPISSGALGELTQLTAGDTSALNPLFVTDTDLLFIDDASGWWNVYRAELGERVRIRHVHATANDCTTPPWEMVGTSAKLFGDFVAITWQVEGHSHIGELNWRSGELEEWVVGIEPVGAPVCAAGTLAVIGASATSQPALYSLDLSHARIRPLESAQPAAVDESWVSLPEAITWHTETVPGDEIDPEVPAHEAYGFFYAPSPVLDNASKPPLVVMVHGGPTSATTPTYRDAIQFFTTRGFAVLDVNHVGSSGYGRQYRQGLRGLWGVVDNADIIAGVKHLEASGQIAKGKAVIRGGSAGGYAVMRALTASDVFAGGASYYGVADLTMLAADTHMFEARYLDGLIGRLPADQARYDHRSPLQHLDQLSAPLLLLQGEDDPIVPPNQTAAVKDALVAQGKPVAVRTYPGEAHGFQSAQVIADALAVELAFYCDILNFQVADELVEVPYCEVMGSA